MPASAMVLYGAINRPDNDTDPAGGAIDTEWRPLWYEVSWPSLIQIRSDNSADIRGVNIYGRDKTGNDTVELLYLNGLNSITGVTEFMRVDKVEALSTNPTYTIQIIQDLGSLILHEINPNERGAFRMFKNATSAGTPSLHYEKLFWKNTDAADVPTVATVTLNFDMIRLIEIGLDPSVNSNLSVANRITAPAGVTFSDDGVALAVPTGTLAAGSAIGVWIKLILAANAGPFDSFMGLEFCGEFPENNLLGCPEIPVNPCPFNCGPPVNPSPDSQGFFDAECDHTCPLGQFAEATYDDGDQNAGPAIRISATSDELVFYGLVAIYIPAQIGIALVLYDGAPLTGLGTVLATHNVTLVVGDALRIEVDDTVATTYRVKVNGSTVITKTLTNAQLNQLNSCVGYVQVLSVPGGTIP